MTLNKSPFTIGCDDWNGLSKLVEECGELLQVCGKIMGSGGDINHWSGDMKAKFIEELGDSMAAHMYFVKKNFSEKDQRTIHNRKNAKLKKFNRWNNMERKKS